MNRRGYRSSNFPSPLVLYVFCLGATSSQTLFSLPPASRFCLRAFSFFRTAGCGKRTIHVQCHSQPCLPLSVGLSLWRVIVIVDTATRFFGTWKWSIISHTVASYECCFSCRQDGVVSHFSLCLGYKVKKCQILSVCMAMCAGKLYFCDFPCMFVLSEIHILNCCAVWEL